MERVSGEPVTGASQREQFLVVPEEAGERVDRYVARHVPALSRATVQRLIAEGLVLVNHATVKPSHRLDEGDLVEVSPPAPAPAQPEPETLPLEILYEDETVAVVNKPAGLVVHPAHGHAAGTLVNALLERYPELRSWPGEAGWPGLVHRLDRDTSGVLVVARTPAAQADLRAQFKAGQVRKVYLALVIGRPPLDRARIEAPIARDPCERKRMAVVREGGRQALTEYQVLERLGDYTLLEARPATGRTHQIRVHLAAIGYPVAGDRLYGPQRSRLGLKRVFLHALQLTFRHPTLGETMTFRVPLPAELQDILAALRRRA